MTEKEKEEVAKRYAGLRLKYGHNAQKNQSGNIYKDPALYDETQKTLEWLAVRMEANRKVLYNGENHYAANGGINYGPLNEASEVYQKFMDELVTYGPGYSGLSPEQQEKVNKIHAAYYAVMTHGKPTSPEEAFKKR